MQNKSLGSRTRQNGERKLAGQNITYSGAQNQLFSAHIIRDKNVCYCSPLKQDSEEYINNVVL
jgi:hypothetical protein